jgi:hypothetical protein
MSRRTYRAGTASDRRYKSLRHFTVRLERDGEVYEGSCHLTGVAEPWVQVTWNGHPKSAAVGDAEPEARARMLLRELVADFGGMREE